MSKRSGLDEFNAMLSKHLQYRQKKDVYIYVHGYKVIFDNPILVASELWHYLGYEGVFIAYAWPATKKTLAYNHDLETASYTSRNLRRLIEYISKNDGVERIHIIGYSAGTRVVAEALWQLALKYGAHKQAIQSLKLHDIILAGSDLDRDQALGYASDGMLEVINKLTIYQSSKDKALGISSWLFGRQRLGQRSNTLKPFNSSIIEFIRRGKLDVIDVSNASDALNKNGHSYFRSSPWVSSDVLMNLRYDLDPQKRGLVKDQVSQIWWFPDNYIQRLRSQIVKFNQTADQESVRE